MNKIQPISPPRTDAVRHVSTDSQINYLNHGSDLWQLDKTI